MNFQQLRIIRETVRRKFNLTDVANALYTSQSGVSKHIKDLEDELGIELFVRRGKRLLGLTEPGKELVGIVERMLLDAKNIKQLAEQFALSDQGELTVATTHTQARYALPAGGRASSRSDFPRCGWCCIRPARRRSSPCCSTAAPTSALPPRRWRRTPMSSPSRTIPGITPSSSPPATSWSASGR